MHALITNALMYAVPPLQSYAGNVETAVCGYTKYYILSETRMPDTDRVLYPCLPREGGWEIQPCVLSQSEAIPKEELALALYTP